MFLHWLFGIFIKKWNTVSNTFMEFNINTIRVPPVLLLLFFLQNIIISVLSLFTMLKAIYSSLHSEFVKQHVTYTSIGNHVLKKNNLKSKSGLKLIHIFLPLKFYPRDFKQIRISYSPGNVLTCYFGFI